MQGLAHRKDQTIWLFIVLSGLLGSESCCSKDSWKGRCGFLCLVAAGQKDVLVWEPLEAD